MKKSELTGLVLTHGDRDPMVALQQLSLLCDQVVLVQDANTDCAALPLEVIEDETEVTIVERAFDSFPNQRNAGIKKAQYPWVLSVDSDELVTRELADVISELAPDDDTKVYSIPRHEYLHGRRLTTRLYCDYHPRLFRSYIRYAPTPEVHEEFKDFDYSTAVHLEAPLVHEMSDTLPVLCKKSFDYGRAWRKFHESDGSSFRELAAMIPGVIFGDQWRDGAKGVGMAAVQFSYELGKSISL